MAEQPAGMTADFAVKLTVGFFANQEAFEIVQPFATNSTVLTDANMCQDCVQSFEAVALPLLVAIISSDCYISFIQAEGAVRGKIPYRDSFDPPDHPGTRDPLVVPTSSCALGVYYQDPADVVIDDKIGIAKTFFAGISLSDITLNDVQTGLQSNIEDYMSTIQAGIHSEIDTPSLWYRVLGFQKPLTAASRVNRTFTSLARSNLYIQKRRLIPRGN